MKLEKKNRKQKSNTQEPILNTENIRTSRKEEKEGSAFDLCCFLLSPYYVLGVPKTFHEPSLISLSWHGDATETQAESKRLTRKIFVQVDKKKKRQSAFNICGFHLSPSLSYILELLV